MKAISNGWVIINIGHPTNGQPGIWADSFAYTRRECIAKFMNGSLKTWTWWKKKYNFRCVKGSVTVSTLQKI